MGGTLWGPDGTGWSVASRVWLHAVGGVADRTPDDELRTTLRWHIDEHVLLLDLQELPPEQQEAFRVAFDEVRAAYRASPLRDGVTRAAHDARLGVFDELAETLRRT